MSGVIPVPPTVPPATPGDPFGFPSPEPPKPKGKVKTYLDHGGAKWQVEVIEEHPDGSCDILLPPELGGCRKDRVPRNGANQDCLA